MFAAVFCCKVGPSPVVNPVIAPLSKGYNISHVFWAIYKGFYITLFTTHLMVGVISLGPHGFEVGDLGKLFMGI